MRSIDLRSIRQLALCGVVVIVAVLLWRAEPRVGRLWLNSAHLAAGAAAIALPLGTLAAVMIVKTNAPGRWLAAILLCGMLLVPLFLVTGAWDAGFGIQGWYTMSTNPHLAQAPLLTGWRAAIWVHGLAAVPWVALIVAVGLRAVESELEEDASLNLSPLGVLWRITLRRAAPAVVIAAVWVAIATSVEISVTDFFQVRTFAEEVYTQAVLGAFDFAGSAQATSAAGVATSVAPTQAAEFPAAGLWLGLSLSTLVAIVGLATVRRWLADFGQVSLRRGWIWRLGFGRWIAGGLLWLIMLLIAGVPLANMIYKAGMHVTQSNGERTREWSALQVGIRMLSAPKEFENDLWQSAEIGIAVATAAVAIGLPLAWSLRLASRQPLGRLLLMGVCLTIPGPLLGIGAIRLLNQSPDSPLAFVSPLYDSHFAPWLVQSVRALPLVTLLLWTSLASVPQALLEAAALDGLGWWKRLLLIALPQRWPAVVAAWIIGLVVSCGELAATVLVMPPGHSGVAIHVFQLLHYGMDDRVAAISLLMALGLAALTGVAGVVLSLGRE